MCIRSLLHYRSTTRTYVNTEEYQRAIAERREYNQINKLYVVTIICDLTKYLVCVKVTDKTAKTVAKAIFEKFVLVYRPMKNIRTNQGTEFTNGLIKELCKLMNIKRFSNSISPPKRWHCRAKSSWVQSIHSANILTEFRLQNAHQAAQVFIDKLKQKKIKITTIKLRYMSDENRTKNIEQKYIVEKKRPP